MIECITIILTHIGDMKSCKHYDLKLFTLKRKKV